MQPRTPATGRYQGFRATAATMRKLSKLEASYGVSGGFVTDGPGALA